MSKSSTESIIKNSENLVPMKFDQSMIGNQSLLNSDIDVNYLK